MTGAERRSARLLFAEELALGEVRPEALERDEVVEAVRDMPVPSGLARRLQARALARGDLAYLRDVATPLAAARRAVLGPERAAGRPRVLLRIDAFPAPGIAPEELAAVHAVLHAARAPYLLTVVAGAFDLAGQVVLRRLADDGVAFALRPDAADDGFEAALDAGVEALRSRALRAEVLSPAPGTLRGGDWAVAAKRYDVVAGGPGDVRRLGFHRAPLWRGEAVWLAAHPPLAGDVAAIGETVARLAADGAALWVPVEIGLEQLAGDLGQARALAAALAGVARPWDEFLAAVRASRDAA